MHQLVEGVYALLTCVWGGWRWSIALETDQNASVGGGCICLTDLCLGRLAVVNGALETDQNDTEEPSQYHFRRMLGMTFGWNSRCFLFY